MIRTNNNMLSYLSLFSFVAIQTAVVMAGQGIGRQNIMRLAREDKLHRHDINGAEVIRSLLAAKSIDKLSGGDVLRTLDPLTDGQMLRSLDQLSPARAPSTLDNFRGDESIAVLDRLTGGDLTGSLAGVDGVAVLAGLERVRQARQRPPSPKRTLDTLTGMAFGQSKRFDSLSGSTFGLSKRDFDEIDNVGFTGFAKRGRNSMLALAKKSYDGSDAYGKRNFDEIDRAGFETYNKRDAKE